MARACSNIQKLTKNNLLAILPSYYDPTYVINTKSGEKIRIDSLNNGPITKIQVLNGGKNYTSAPEVIISGGGGYGATAVAVLLNNKINRIDITNSGQNYTKVPNVEISGGGGSGAITVAYLKDLDNILKIGFYNGNYKRIEMLYPRNLLLENNNWEIKSFNPRTKEVCIAINKKVKYRQINNGVCPRTDPEDIRPLTCPHGTESINTILSYTIQNISPTQVF